MSTANPFLQDNRFETASWDHLERGTTGAKVMTVQGAINASFILFAICVASAVGGWLLMSEANVPAIALAMGGGILGMILGFASYFKPQASAFIGPVYAIVEGAFVAGVTALVADRFLGSTASAEVAKPQTLTDLMNNPQAGLIFQAVLLTFGIFAALLIAFSMKAIRATPLGTKIFMVAMLGVCLTLLGGWIAALFGAPSFISTLAGNGMIGIGFSLLMVGLASYSLVIDFTVIDDLGSTQSQPKYLEWYCAIGLLSSLVFLYLEVLKLLAKLKSRE